MKIYKLTFNHPVKAKKAWCEAVMKHNCISCPLKVLGGERRACDWIALHQPDKMAAVIDAEVIRVEEPVRLEPELGQRELAICRAAGAKWVTRESKGSPFGTGDVTLWEQQPTRSKNGVYNANGNFRGIAVMNASVFPSVYPGDCINVEELLK